MNAPRKIGVVTSSRADFGLLKGLMQVIDADPALELAVYVTGMHHANDGASLHEVRQAASLWKRVVEIPTWSPGDGAGDIACQIARGVEGFAAVFAAQRPDMLVVLGDRYDVLPAALAALPFTLPIAHISGGDVTEGVIDDAIRHCLTKLSHLHFPTTQEYGRRILQMGEEAWRVVVSGQPGIDLLNDFVSPPRADVLTSLGLDPARMTTLVTYHPETLRPNETKAAIDILLTVAERIDTQIVFTAPNTDPGSAAIRAAILDGCARKTDWFFRESLGRELYWRTLTAVDCMVGNSSSGVTEAASFRLPVVDIGDRQKGRIAPANVIHAPTEAGTIETAWRRALSPSFRSSTPELRNPYGDGHAVPRIVDRLRTVKFGDGLTRKRFVDILNTNVL